MIPNEVIVSWCDNGLVDGKFMEGLVTTILTSGMPITGAMRVQGNQIARQRQNVINHWLDDTDFEWMLWLDSDIVLSNEVLYKLWSNAHAVDRPVVSGVYFISKENEQSLMTPYPAVFNWVEGTDYQISYVHPLPAGDNLIKAGCAGFGLLLMHRSVIEKMRKKHGTIPFFNETGIGGEFISEDINFFRLMRDADIPLHVHTGATVKHMKRFAFDLEFYKQYWNNNDKP